MSGLQCDLDKVINDYSPPEADWLDMATEAEVKNAVHDGVLDALKEWGYYRYEDGRNLVDDAKQQTGSLLGLQTQIDALIAAVKALKPAA